MEKITIASKMSKKLLLLLSGLTLFLQESEGQRIQPGLSISLNCSFFHKGSSSYDTAFYAGFSGLGYGISVPLFINLNKKLGLKTGYSILNKTYEFLQKKYAFPGVVGSESVIADAWIIASEVPVILCLTPWDTINDCKAEFKLGCVFSSNATKRISLSAFDVEYYGTDSIHRRIVITPDSKKHFSTDIYFGVGIVKYKGSARKHELTFSYQYGLSAASEFRFLTILWNSTETRSNYATVKPALSYLAFTYTFYPGFFKTSSNR